MGRHSVILSALPLLLATPALAQQEESAPPVFNLPGSQPPQDKDRQGPELDVFRGAPATTTQPPVVVPSITLPPAVTPAQPTLGTPQPAPQAPEHTPASATERQVAPTPAAPSAERSQPAAPPPGDTAPPPAPSESTAAPPATPPAPAPEAAAPLQPARANGNWMWLAGAIALVFLLLGTFLFRRRNRAEAEEQPLATEPEANPAPPAPEPVPPVAPTPAPAATLSPAPAPASTDRPWIDLNLEVRSARFSLMGATISYALTLSNRGKQPAEDILIRSIISNADADQQALLQQFFTGSAGLPVHSIVTVAPGESQSVTGELRLLPDQIAPVKMGDRALLIPLVAFDAQYRWGIEQNAPGHGRTGRAFIVGQEQTPPTDRLAPFRLDLGPRQFRAPASRATALALAS